MTKEVRRKGLGTGWALHLPKTAAGCGGPCEYAEGWSSRRPYVAESGLEGLEGYGEEPAVGGGSFGIAGGGQRDQ